MSENEIQSKSTPGYVMVFGIISLILVIIGFLVPVIGAGYIVPLALICSAVSLYGKTNGISIATIIIAAVKLIISPTFWIQVTNSAGKGNSFFAWIGIICFILSLYFAIKNRNK